MTWVAVASIGLSLGLLVPVAAGVQPSQLTATPADGRLRGQDFAVTVTKVAWPDSIEDDGTTKLAPPGQRYVVFSYAVAVNAQALQPDGAEQDISAALQTPGRTIPIELDTSDGASSAGPDGWTSGSGQSTALVSNHTHAVDFVVSQGSFSQSFNLWTLARVPPAPIVLYRDPSGPAVSATAPTSSTLALANPSDGFADTAALSLQSATLGYFGPQGASASPTSPAQAVLQVVLDAEAPNNPDDQTASGHYLGGQQPLPGSMLTFTPEGGSPVTATLSDAGDTTGKGKSDDGLFDGTYSFVVPGDVTAGTVSVAAGSFTGAEFTLYTAESGPTTLNVTSPAVLPLTFPAVPATASQRRPPWVGRPLPPTAAQSASGGTATGSPRGFPIWLAVVIVVVVAAAVVLWQRRRRRPAPAGEVSIQPEGPAPRIVEASSPHSTLAAATAVASPTVTTLTDAPDVVDTHAPVPEDGDHGDLTVYVLGPVEFSGLQQQSDRRIVYELLAYLACHDRRHLRSGQIQIGLWPLGSARPEVSEKTLRNYLSELRACVGSTHLPEATSRDGYLLRDVRTDWEQFQSLARQADTTGSETATRLRGEALALVRGRPFEGIAPDTYEWVAEEHLDTQMTVAIATCALRLATEHLEAGNPGEALSAAAAGLRGAPDDYDLWQTGARALAEKEDRTALRRWLGDAARHLDPEDLNRIERSLGTAHDSDHS